MKILIFGKTGQVGRALLSALGPLGQLCAPQWRGSPCPAVGDLVEAGNQPVSLLADFRDPVRLYESTLAWAPDVIVNAAAWTAVDEAEHHETEVMLINAAAPKALARAAADSGALLIHFSSDYVFDGRGTQPWVESDLAKPCNVYGRSKLAADEAILNSGCRHLIFRTSWVYSLHGSGFLQQMMRLAMARQTVSVVNDQIGAPTDAQLIAAITATAIERYFGNGQAVADGLYHLSARGETSWFDYAGRIFSRMRSNDLALALTRVQPVSTPAYGSPARRPLNSRLDSGKLVAALGVRLPEWQKGVDAAVDALCTRVRD